jgi:hypothetical protein
MQWAPVCMFAVGYWMMSNRQIFENYVESSDHANPLVEKTGHVIFENITSTPAFILFIMAIVLIIGVSFKRLILHFLKKTPFIINIKSDVDENLPNYFKALEYDDSMYLMSLEKNLRTRYGVKTLMDYTLTNIVKATPADKKITGIGLYDILANIRYCNSFQYDYYDQVFKMNFEEESNKVKLWLSLGFMKNTGAEGKKEFMDVFGKTLNLNSKLLFSLF